VHGEADADPDRLGEPVTATFDPDRPPHAALGEHTTAVRTGERDSMSGEALRVTTAYLREPASKQAQAVAEIALATEVVDGVGSATGGRTDQEIRPR
jgi:hypothetical protein